MDSEKGEHNSDIPDAPVSVYAPELELKEKSTRFQRVTTFLRTWGVETHGYALCFLFCAVF